MMIELAVGEYQLDALLPNVEVVIAKFYNSKRTKLIIHADTFRWMEKGLR